MNTAKLLLACLIITTLVFTVPSVHAAQSSTRIYELIHPVHATAGNLEPMPVTAIVYYNNTVPGYSLVVGIIDMDMKPQQVTPGIVTLSSDPCVNQPVLAALCIIRVPAASGAEHLEFRIGGLLGETHAPGTWNLNITASLWDTSNKLVPNSVSSILFGIRLTPLTLTVAVPAAVTISVDGVKQAAGPAAVGVTLGKHNVTVPALAQVDPTTRLRFDHWSDGPTETNRTVTVTNNTSLEALYVTQYLLTITGPQTTSTGAGWYDANDIAKFSVQETEPLSGLLGILGGKLKFQGWYENGTLVTDSTTGQATMNQPHTVDAVWQTDYSIPAALIAGIVIIVVLVFLIVRSRAGKRRGRGSRTTKK